MTNKIIINSVSGIEPTTTNLKVGQVGINTADKVLFFNVGGAIESLGKSSTESRAGIAKVSTNAQVAAGSDDSAFMTAKKFFYALDVTAVIDKLVSNLWLKLAGKIFPVGAAIPWFLDAAPDGFAIMKGQAFSTSTYPELAKVFPSGVVPDMRGSGVIGKEDGETVGVWEEGQVKEHGHDATISSTNLGTKNTSSSGSHSHNIRAGKEWDGVSNSPVAVSKSSYSYNTYTDAVGNHYHSVAIGSHAHTVSVALFGALKNTINHRKVNWIVRLA